jgi:hypothetical protein
MSTVLSEWIDAETPHAKVLRNESVMTSAQISDDPDIQSAVERVQEFAAIVTRESLDQPLIIV